ncbi:MAG: tetratricopeptide repeat protein [Pseudothermotoga sp.]|uniref:tetratricopeptide repeat protein n=1 Tax=Pseudothermotoga sp. TaxID=2033661 RepID=UPI002582D1BD|nr:tetratricopeptide repeat protein [Pseudothermotoga sp.]MDI6863074.1 tetratricopeptide repeat protein [Pseudothermotoga sp.]
MRYAVVLLVLVSILAFSNALEYYKSALNAYTQGDYGRALEWFETALKLEPRIESYDPLVKLRMGVCAYMIRDYTKARAYLEPYESSNAVAASILKAIREGSKANEEWLEWLRARIPPPTTTQPQATKKSTSLFLVIGVFIISFAATFLLLRLMKRAKKVGTEEGELTAEERLERQLQSIDVVSKDLEQGKRVIDFEADEELRKLEAQIESIVQEIISKESKEGEKKESETLVGEDPFAILKKMEEKEQYNEEDAKLLSQIMQQLVNNPEDSTNESGEQDRS